MLFKIIIREFDEGNVGTYSYYWEHGISGSNLFVI
jgi:hypothetical protein